MSLDATIWAWKVRQKQKKGGSIKPLKKLVLLSLSDRAGEDHCAIQVLLDWLKTQKWTVKLF